jgi:hypothetical protein
LEPTQGAGALSSNAGGLTEAEKGPVISLSVILGLMCCCGIGYYIFVYYRRAKEEEENDDNLSPYERWMRNEELKARGESFDGLARNSKAASPATFTDDLNNLWNWITGEDTIPTRNRGRNGPQPVSPDHSPRGQQGQDLYLGDSFGDVGYRGSSVGSAGFADIYGAGADQYDEQYFNQSQMAPRFSLGGADMQQFQQGQGSTHNPMGMSAHDSPMRMSDVSGSPSNGIMPGGMGGRLHQDPYHENDPYAQMNNNPMGGSTHNPMAGQGPMQQQYTPPSPRNNRMDNPMNMQDPNMVPSMQNPMMQLEGTGNSNTAAFDAPFVMSPSQQRRNSGNNGNRRHSRNSSGILPDGDIYQG